MAGYTDYINVYNMKERNDGEIYNINTFPMLLLLSHCEGHATLSTHLLSSWFDDVLTDCGT